MIKFAIFVGSSQKGMMVSLGKRLAERYPICFLATKDDVADAISNIGSISSEDVAIVDRLGGHLRGSLVDECLVREEKYGEALSMWMSYDRALGRGYILNADRYPAIARSNWSYEHKLAELLKTVTAYEDFIERFKPTVLLALVVSPLLFRVCAAHGVRCVALNTAKFANNFLWADTPYWYSSALISEIEARLVDSQAICDENVPDYQQVTHAKKVFSAISYSFSSSAYSAAKQAAMEIYRLVRGTRKRDTYVLFGWVPPLLRSWFNYRYFKRHGKKPSDLCNTRFIFVPLNMEPEISLLWLSPEFNNSAEMITWISKSIPADVRIVVKEQPQTFGVRSRHYYSMLRQMGNVEIADPDSPSIDWIEKCTAVATITGTAAVEAVFLEKPVLSFGMHQPVNALPTVRFADSYSTTREGIQALLRMQRSDLDLKRSRIAYWRALEKVSFALPGYEGLFRSIGLHPDLAGIAIDNLEKSYPELFDEGGKS